MGYLRKPNKNLKLAGMCHEEWERRKRHIKQEQMAAILEPLRALVRAGVRMVMANRNGELVTAAVVPVVALASYDQPEIKSVTNVKAAYKNMRTFCHAQVCEQHSGHNVNFYSGHNRLPRADPGCRGPIRAAHDGEGRRGGGRKVQWPLNSGHYLFRALVASVMWRALA